ncbi:MULTISPECIES: hypothetical protein [unclassified Microcoleus]|uniref:hypothetical protein n=1 Tax=unclassified Microcoleus TaxID=2642155 RepID=UPI002FD50A17
MFRGREIKVRSPTTKFAIIIKNRREQIARNARETLTAFKAGNAKRGTLEQLKADLLGNYE